MEINFRVDVDTALAPEQVVAAYTDFSERRPDIWPGLSRKFFQVHSLNETSADVTEGSDKPISVWAREKYDWSTPNLIKWSVTQSDFSLPGHTMEVKVAPTGSGSHVTLNYDRGVYGFKGNVAGVMMKLFGKKIITSYYRKCFDKLAAA
jgi:hypothetical protein